MGKKTLSLMLVLILGLLSFGVVVAQDVTPEVTTQAAPSLELLTRRPIVADAANHVVTGWLRTTLRPHPIMMIATADVTRLSQRT